MSTLSPRIGLKRNDGTDPFLRQDYLDNLDLIDVAPGYHICTSTTRPSWGTGQAGRLIYETNTRRPLQWTGTAWAEPLTAGGLWTLNQHIAAYTAAGASNTYSLGSITLIRPTAIFVMLWSSLSFNSSSVEQRARIVPKVNAADITLGSASSPGWVRWPHLASVNPGSEDARPVLMFGQVSLAAGTHSVSATVTADNISSTSVYCFDISASILAVTTNGGADTV